MTLYPSDDVKTIVKSFICRDIGVTADQLILLLRQRNIALSKFTISSIRMSFREDLRVLDYLGMINLSSFPRGKYASVSDNTNILRKRRRHNALTEPDNNIDWWKPSQSPPARRRAMSSQRRILLAILEHERIPMTPKALAKACAMPRGAVRYLLHMMLRAGQVARVQHGKYCPIAGRS